MATAAAARGEMTLMASSVDAGPSSMIVKKKARSRANSDDEVRFSSSMSLSPC